MTLGMMWHMPRFHRLIFVRFFFTFAWSRVRDWVVVYPDSQKEFRAVDRVIGTAEDGLPALDTASIHTRVDTVCTDGVTATEALPAGSVLRGFLFNHT